TLGPGTYCPYSCIGFFTTQLTVCLFFNVSIFFFNDTATTEIYTLSLHDALPILIPSPTFMAILPINFGCGFFEARSTRLSPLSRSEEHTSELQSRFDLVCRLLLEKKKTVSPRKLVHPSESRD